MTDELSIDRTPAGRSRPAPGPGTWIVLAMLALAALAGLLSVGVHYWQGRRALEFWGPQAARLIGGARQTAIWRLAPPGGIATSTRAGSEPFEIVERKD